jgi:hypothetical protein
MTILDNPVKGDVSRYSEGLREQHDPQILADALAEAFAHPSIVAIRWTQYTPYFNDGDACVFSVYADDDIWKFTTTADDAGDYENGWESIYNLYENVEWVGKYPDSKAVYTYKNDENRELHELCRKVQGVLGSGHHNVLLNQKFGDPATVTAYPDRFEVEHYDHD